LPIEHAQELETTDAREASERERCRRQRSTTCKGVNRQQILAEFLDAVMNRNLAVCQNALKRELVHVRKMARLTQRQALLAKERHREFPA
jgi:hypothetical protein